MKKLDKIHGKIVAREDLFNEENQILIINANIEDQVKQELHDDFELLKELIPQYRLEYDLMKTNPANYGRYRKAILGFEEESIKQKSKSKSRK